jgi:nitrite reductase/ring-hydroxylating ferredoxin subunit
MPESRYICETRDIDDPGSRGFSIEQGEKTIHGFVVLKNGQFYAYANQCPHTGAPLDWVEHRFLDADEALIQCATHDARFIIESGHCVSGPCAGDSLTALRIAVRDNKLYLALRG